MTKEQLDEILRKHKKWLNGEEGGKRADLSGTDLSGINLSGLDMREAIMLGANLTEAIMIGTNLSKAIMTGAIMRRVDLSCADLTSAIMSGANMHAAIMRGTDLTEAIMIGTNLSRAIMSGSIMRGTIMRGTNLILVNLSCADLSGAILEDVDFNEYTSFFAMTCPEEGPFIGFKKCSEYIVKLLILEDAKRSSATSRKCRCDKAKILSITNLDGSEPGITKIESDYDRNFVYEVGKTVCVEDFDDDRWNECSTGIHFFITREEAVNY